MMDDSKKRFQIGFIGSLSFHLLVFLILALCAHSYFAQRLDTSITNMEQCFSALLEAESRGDI